MRPSANSAAFSWRIHLSRWPAVSAVHPRGQRLLFHARGVVSFKSKTLEMDEGQASAGAQSALTALLHR